MLSWLAAEDLKLKLFGNTSHSAVLHFSSLKAAMIFVSVTGSTYGLGNSLKSIWHAMSDYSFEKAKAIVRLFKDPQKAPRDFRLGLLLWNSSWTRWLCSREPRGRQTCEGSTALFFWGVFGVWILTMRLHFDLSQGFEKQWNLVDHRGHERPFPCTGPAAESVSCWVFFFFFCSCLFVYFFPTQMWHIELWNEIRDVSYVLRNAVDHRGNVCLLPGFCKGTASAQSPRVPSLDSKCWSTCEFFSLFSSKYFSL